MEHTNHFSLKTSELSKNRIWNKKYISRPIFWCQFLLSKVKTKCGKEANFYCFNYCCESSRFEFLPCARFCRPHNNTHIVSLCTVRGPSESYKFFWSLESPWIVFYSQRELKTRLIRRLTIPKVEKRAVQGLKSNHGRFTELEVSESYLSKLYYRSL